MRSIRKFVLTMGCSFFAITKPFSGLISTNIWKKDVLKYCWSPRNSRDWMAKNPLVQNPSAQKGIHQDPAELEIDRLFVEQVNIKGVGITVQSLGLCKPFPDNVDFVIQLTKGLKIKTDVEGLSFVGPPDAKFVGQPHVYLKTRQTYDLLNLKVVALHELGHVLGLLHEHTRLVQPTESDTLRALKSKGGCSDETASMIIGFRESKPMNSEARAYSEYDYSSIMDYCFVFNQTFLKRSFENRLRRKALIYQRSSASFSESDLKALRCTYRSDKNSKCNDHTI